MANWIKNRKFMTQAVTVSLLALVSAFQACGPGKLQKSEFASSRNNALDDVNPAAGGTFVPGVGGMIPVESTKTVGVSYSENVLASLVSMAGTVSPSARTLNAFNTERTKIAESGEAVSVNAPMWMAITNLAGEVCFDLIGQEKALQAGQRRIFNQINFAAGPSQISDAAKDDVIRRLARSAWARNETDQEKTMIKTTVNGSFGGSGTAADTDRAMMMTCTAVFASLDAHDR